MSTSSTVRRHRTTSLLCLLALTLLPLVSAFDQQHFKAGANAHSQEGCLHAATASHINRLLLIGGEGTIITLCPYAQVQLDSYGDSISFTAPRQSIHTLGDPEDHSRATLTISHPRGHFLGELSTAIKADCNVCRGVKIHHIQIDGGRSELGGLEGGDALILIGGPEGEQQVNHVDAWAARGYAIVHASEGSHGTCSGVVVTENHFHSSGDAPLDLMLTSELKRLRDGPAPHLGQDRPGHWTDGISIACQRSTVLENTLRDISGIAIALRGAPGTQVVQNTIVARDRDMLAGIAVVAHPIFHGRLLAGGVAIRENSIHAGSAMIRIGISTGAGAWSNDEDEENGGDYEIAFGSEIVKNRLSSYTGYFGYAIAISDARGIVVLNNAVSASVWGFQTTACFKHPSFALPAPLIRDTRSVLGSLQGEFRELHFSFLLCVGPGSDSSSHEHELSRHQINEKYIEQVAIKLRSQKKRKGKSAVDATPDVIPLNEMQAAVDGDGKRKMKALKRKKAAMEEGLGAEHTGEENASAQQMQGMKRKMLNAPRQAGGGRHGMVNRMKN